MNHYKANDIKSENTENFSLPSKDINKIFNISKTNINNYFKFNPLKEEPSIILRKNFVISNEIKFQFNKTAKNKNFGTQNDDLILKPKNSVDVQKSPNLVNNKRSIEKNKNNKDNNYIKKIKNKNIKKYDEKKIRNNNNSLIKPILIEMQPVNKNPINNIPNSVNTVKSIFNNNNNFQTNSIFNNFILNNNNININKNNININQKLPFSSIYNNYNQLIKEQSQFPLRFPPFLYTKQKFQQNASILPKYHNFQKNEIISPEKKEKFNISLVNSSSQESTTEKNKPRIIIFRKINNRKGRKSKEACTMNLLSKHTKFSADNMMRKIKNKIIESSRQLANKVLLDEINSLKTKYKFPYKEFRKIKGSFSQELNIKFNLWFYQIKISDIFSLEISTKYSSTEKLSNKELIEYLFDAENNNNFKKTKQILNMPFHQYYHDIFLSENQNWMQYFNISPEDNKYKIEYLLANLDDKDDNDDNNENSNKSYVNQIKALAENYEDFFLNKKMRNVDLSEKKNDFIKNFMINTQKSDYLKYAEKVKEIKNYYDNRKQELKISYSNFINPYINKINNIYSINTLNNSMNKTCFLKNSDSYKNIFFRIDNTKKNDEFLERKRKPFKSEIIINNNKLKKN